MTRTVEQSRKVLKTVGVEAMASVVVDVVVGVAADIDTGEEQSKVESQYRREPKSNADESGV